MTTTIGSISKYPVIAYGAGTAWYKSDTVEEGVSKALKAGFVHLDGAEIYANEEAVGRAIKTSGIARDKLFITTKVHGGAGEIQKTLRRQLTELQLDYVDLYLIHDPTAPASKGKSLSEAWQDMEQVQADGLAKDIGVSNYRVAHLEETLKSAKSKPVINQIELHPYIYSAQKPIIDFCHSHNIAIAAYSPQAPLTKFPGLSVDAPMQRIAQELGITPGQVLLKWAQAAGDVLVTTTSKEERLREFLAVPGIKSLTKEQFDEIAEAGGKEPVKRIYMTHVTDDIAPVKR